MKTTTETEYLYPNDWISLEIFIEHLNNIRRKANTEITVTIHGNSDNGYWIELGWERPLTEEEAKAHEEYLAKSEEYAKRERRKKWEELNKEFGSRSKDEL